MPLAFEKKWKTWGSRKKRKIKEQGGKMSKNAIFRVGGPKFGLSRGSPPPDFGPVLIYAYKYYSVMNFKTSISLKAKAKTFFFCRVAIGVRRRKFSN